jgi:hypothetical protein
LSNKETQGDHGFIASLMGIVFSVVLVMGQMGLYFGFSAW